MTKVKVLFVCLGNICRSPLAEGIFRKKVEDKGVGDRFEIDSCGTSNFHIGELPDPRTRANAIRNGIELNHRGRQFSKMDFEDFDYILAMDESNLKNINRLAPPSVKSKVMKMRHFDDLYCNADVPDPYYGGEKGFQQVFEILDRSAERLLQQIITDHDFE